MGVYKVTFFAPRSLKGTFTEFRKNFIKGVSKAFPKFGIAVPEVRERPYFGNAISLKKFQYHTPLWFLQSAHLRQKLKWWADSKKEISRDFLWDDCNICPKGHLLQSSHVLMEKFFKKTAKEESSLLEKKKWKWGNSKKEVANLLGGK